MLEDVRRSQLNRTGAPSTSVSVSAASTLKTSVSLRCCAIESEEADGGRTNIREGFSGPSRHHWSFRNPGLCSGLGLSVLFCCSSSATGLSMQCVETNEERDSKVQGFSRIAPEKPLSSHSS